MEGILQNAVKNKCNVCISFATIAELYYITWQEEGESAAKELIVLVKSLPMSIIESVERLTLTAGRIKANHKLSMADAFIAATAVHVKGILIHKDPEFDPLNEIVTLEALPYKQRRKPSS